MSIVLFTLGMLIHRFFDFHHLDLNSLQTFMQYCSLLRVLTYNFQVKWLTFLISSLWVLVQVYRSHPSFIRCIIPFWILFQYFSSPLLELYFLEIKSLIFLLFIHFEHLFDRAYFHFISVFQFDKGHLCVFLTRVDSLIQYCNLLIDLQLLQLFQWNQVLFETYLFSITQKKGASLLSKQDQDVSVSENSH